MIWMWFVIVLKQRDSKKKPYSIVVVAEGINNQRKVGCRIYRKKLDKRLPQETRETILGYIQRGGSPSPMDRILATRFGAYAVKLISQRKFGQMVALHGKKRLLYHLKK